MRVHKWLLDHSYKGVMAERTWMGVRTLKNPLDAWVYQEIVWETKPETIVELGSQSGGSALFFAHLLDAVGAGRVISVDVQRHNFVAEHPRIELVTGDTRSAEVVAAVRSRCTGRTMLIHDADHHGQVVLEDLRNYGPVVSAGCYLIVEDGLSEVLGGLKPGPLWASERFLAENPEFDHGVGPDLIQDLLVDPGVERVLQRRDSHPSLLLAHHLLV